MLKLTALLSITSLLIACSSLNATPPLNSPPTPTAMSTAIGIIVQPITLQAREEKRPPVGQPPTADRDIGFADVFFQLENHQAIDQTVVIEKIQIQDAATGRVYMTTSASQTVNLKPLEFAAQDIHLTNKAGFMGKGAVQAIATITVADQQKILTSPPVVVDRL
jgi:hypothetical protein